MTRWLAAIRRRASAAAIHGLAGPTTRSSRRVAIASVLALLAAGCTTQSAGHPGPGPAGSLSASSAVSEPAAAGQQHVRGFGTVTRSAPGCTPMTQSAPALPASDTAMTAVPAQPFGVAVSSDGRWAFVSLISEGIGLFRIGGDGSLTLVRTEGSDFSAVGNPAVGNVLSPDDRYLLIADGGAGAAVLDVRRAEQGGSHAVLGLLTAPVSPPAGSIEVAVTPDDRYAFVSLEDAESIAVFSLRRALTGGFGPADYVGSIPTQLGPVGLAVSPDGRWLYSTSEEERGRTQVGSLSVISIAKAESDPAHSVVARVAAGCNPVRVITSADGNLVWVTARASDALLAFSASALRTDPSHALLADVPVGEAPVGLALVRGGSLIVVADSNRFSASGAHASLAVVDVANALAGRPALIGYLAAGSFPREMAMVPGGSALLVSNFGSDQLEVVKLADLP